jgi:hypothetical protein
MHGAHAIATDAKRKLTSYVLRLALSDCGLVAAAREGSARTVKSPTSLCFCSKQDLPKLREHVLSGLAAAAAGNDAPVNPSSHTDRASSVT